MFLTDSAKYFELNLAVLQVVVLIFLDLKEKPVEKSCSYLKNPCQVVHNAGTSFKFVERHSSKLLSGNQVQSGLIFFAESVFRKKRYQMVKRNGLKHHAVLTTARRTNFSKLEWSFPS